MTATYRQAISIGLRKSVNEALSSGYRIYGYTSVNLLVYPHSDPVFAVYAAKAGDER